jgi:hypothetical protein
MNARKTRNKDFVDGMNKQDVTGNIIDRKAGRHV